MAKPVVITSDSTCDLPRDLLDRFDIRIVPLTILLGENRIVGGLVNSGKYVRDLTARVQIAERKKEEVWIEIEN